METSFMELRRNYRRSLLILLLLSSIAPIPAFAHAGEDHEGLPWPPEPRGISNVIIHADVAQERNIQSLTSDRMLVLEERTKNNPTASRYLGKKFKRMTLIKKDDKKTGSVVDEIVFYSYDKNATVKVEFADENIKSVKSIPAQEYQPEITDEEATEAEKLARTYFVNHGVSKAADLKAFSILGYKPEGAGFYNTRVIYVSFHNNEDTPPEFMAWVDLSNQRVIKTREEQQ